MNQNDVRKGIAQSEGNAGSAGLYMIEVFLLSVAIGLVTSSWLVFGILLFGLGAAFYFSKALKIVSIIFILAWATFGFVLGFMMFGVIAGIMLGLIFFFISGAIHANAQQYSEDIKE